MITSQAIFEYSPLAMATTNGPTHKLRSVNAAFCDLHGKQADDLIGHPVADVISGTGRESVLALLDRVYSGEKSGVADNQRCSTPGGDLRFEKYTVWNMPADDEAADDLAILVTDVSEQIRADEWTEGSAGDIDLYGEMRQINERLVISAVQLQKLAERNRAVAEALQYSLLWQQPEKLFDGLKVAAFYEPALDDALVGGDFFDAFSLTTSNSIVLVVGDVTGKGLKAAARTVEVRFALRAFAQDYNSPAVMVERLNKFICDFHYKDADVGNDLVVLSVIVLDPITGATQAVSAGAEPPLIVRSSGEVEEVNVRGLILGVNHNAAYSPTEVSLQDGDTLIMTTDGITETRRGRDFFGSERLLDVARKEDASGTLHHVGKAILEAARAYGGGHFSDDICLLLARRDYSMTMAVNPE